MGDLADFALDTDLAARAQDLVGTATGRWRTSAYATVPYALGKTALQADSSEGRGQSSRMGALVTSTPTIRRTPRWRIVGVPICRPRGLFDCGTPYEGADPERGGRWRSVARPLLRCM